MRKEEQYQILMEKQGRINLKVNAMKKYEEYLESVKERNSDEYSELQDILARYKTLKDSNEKLNKKMAELERELDGLKNQVVKYEKDMKTDIMQLNNEIAQLQQ